MPISTYDASAGVFVRILTQLSGVLDKGAAHAAALKFEPAILLTARLAPDMWSTAEQVRSACNFATRGSARLAQVEIPTYDGKDSTFEECKARIAWALDFVKRADRSAIDSAAERTIKFVADGNDVSMTGAHYLTTFVLPHFYFHAATAYDILRHNGVPLVKNDYMGNPEQ